MGYLRTLLAITVVFVHSPYGSAFVGGRNAVQIFYIISGFLIAHVLRTNTKYQDPIKFYYNRALRIYPIYYGVALLTVVYIFLFDRAIFELYTKIPLSAGALLVAVNTLIFGQDWVMFLGIVNGQLRPIADFTKSEVLLWKGLLVPQAWTLGVELTFYAIAPFILKSRGIIVSLLALSLSVRLILFKFGLGRSDPWTYRFFPSELALFLLGALSNHYLLPRWQRFMESAKVLWLPHASTYTLLAFCVFFSDIQINNIIKHFLLFGFVVILLPLCFLFQAKSRSDKWIGELSYPIYIGHMLVIWFIASLLSIGGFVPDPLTHTLFNVGASCVFAILLNKVISARIETLRSKIRSQA